MKRCTVLILLAALLACSQDDHDSHESHDDHGSHDDQVSHEPGVVQLSPELVERLDIRTAPVSRRALPAELSTTGQVDFQQDRLAHVTPRIPGRVEAVRADLGDEIDKGQALAVIDSIELGQAKAALLEAKAHEELARQNAEREEGLFAEHIASEKEMLSARAARKEATVRMRNAEETLRLYGLSDTAIQSLSLDDRRASLLPVRSPLSGRVVEKHVTVGELVTPERNMFTVADLGQVWIWIDVYERDLAQVHLDDDVEVQVDAFPEDSFSGKVSYISAQVEANTRTVRARIDAPNPDGKLRPGMFVRVRLTDPHHEHNGHDEELPLVVPESAVQRDGNTSIVFVPLGPDRFRRVEITPGRTAAGFVEILSELDAESVVINGAFLLKSEASKEDMGAGHAH